MDMTQGSFGCKRDDTSAQADWTGYGGAGRQVGR